MFEAEGRVDVVCWHLIRLRVRWIDLIESGNVWDLVGNKRDRLSALYDNINSKYRIPYPRLRIYHSDLDSVDSSQCRISFREPQYLSSVFFDKTDCVW